MDVTIGPKKGEIVNIEGFYSNFTLLKMGWEQWKRTGKLPHPSELLGLPYRWVRDIFRMDALVEANKIKVGDD